MTVREYAMQGDHTTVIWSFKRRLTWRLMAWALPNIILGAILARTRNPGVRGFGMQAAGWGSADAAIALGGQHLAERKQAVAMPIDEIDQARALRRLLRIGVIVDLLSLAFAIRLIRSDPRSRGACPRSTLRAALRGHGVGIALQAIFLLIFDLYHARKTPQLPPLIASGESGRFLLSKAPAA